MHRNGIEHVETFKPTQVTKDLGRDLFLFDDSKLGN